MAVFRLSAQGLVAALLIGGIVCAVSLDSAGARTARTAGPRIVVHPDSQMVNGSVRLVGTHFKAGSTLELAECSQTTWIVPLHPCDTTNAVTVKTKGAGQFTTTFTVQTCPGGATGPPGFSETCYIGSPTPTGIDVIELVGSATVTVTGP